MAKLKGKVAIVTGASRGIGKAIAELFAKEGAKVVCSARTLKEGEHPLEGSLETTVAGIKKAGGEAEAVTCDVSSEADCEKLVEQTHKLYRAGRRAGEQRGADLLHPGQGFSAETMDAIVRSQHSRPVHAESPGAQGHDPAQVRIDRQHFVGRGDRTRPRTIQERDRVSRRRMLWRREGSARALHAGTRRRSLRRRNLGDVRIAVASRRDSGHGASPSRHRTRRPDAASRSNGWRSRRSSSPPNHSTRSRGW